MYLLLLYNHFTSFVLVEFFVIIFLMFEYLASLKYPATFHSFVSTYVGLCGSPPRGCKTVFWGGVKMCKNVQNACFWDPPAAH